MCVLAEGRQVYIGLLSSQIIGCRERSNCRSAAFVAGMLSSMGVSVLPAG